MSRNLWIRNAEIGLLLPATIVVAPMAAFAAGNGVRHCAAEETLAKSKEC